MYQGIDKKDLKKVIIYRCFQSPEAFGQRVSFSLTLCSYILLSQGGRVGRAHSAANPQHCEIIVLYDPKSLIVRESKQGKKESERKDETFEFLEQVRRTGYAPLVHSTNQRHFDVV